MIRPHRLTPLLLVLALVACTVERRSSADDEQTSGAEGAGESTGAVEARDFLERLQEARAAGRVAFVRERLHPEALIVVGDRSVEGSGAGPPDDAERLLTPALAVRGWEEVSGFEVGADSTAVFVLRYPPAADDGRRPLETVVLAPDSAGWRIRMLVRAHGGPGPPGS